MAEKLRPPKVSRPRDLIAMGIPRTRLNWWITKGYAPATGPTTKGGGVGYTARDAIRACLMEFFVEHEGYEPAVAALMIRPLLEQEVVPGPGGRPEVFRDMLHLLLGKDGEPEWVWLVSVGQAPGQLVRAGIDTGENALFSVLGANLFVPQWYLDNFPDIMGIRFFDMSKIVLAIVKDLSIDPYLDVTEVPDHYKPGFDGHPITMVERLARDHGFEITHDQIRAKQLWLTDQQYREMFDGYRRPGEPGVIIRNNALHKLVKDEGIRLLVRWKTLPDESKTEWDRLSTTVYRDQG